jgi:uncharacterized protein YqeY
MSLLKRFDDDLKTALKASEAERVSILRLVKSAVKNKQIDKGSELSEEEIISVLSTMIKQGRESIDQFTKGNRMDLAQREERDIAVLQAYMPQQLSLEKIDMIISESIKETAAAGPQDMGKVMRIVMPRVKGVADGKYVNQRVKELLEAVK